MQNKVMEAPTFESDIWNDRIKLLEAIQVAMHTQVCGQYPFTTLTTVLERFLAVQQQDGEDALEYTKRFKQQRNIMKTQVGKDVLNTFTMHTPNYNVTGITKEQKIETQECRLSALVCLHLFYNTVTSQNTGHWWRDYNFSISKRTINIPQQWRDALDALSNHKWDQVYHHKNKKKPKQSKLDKNDQKKKDTEKKSK